MITTVQERDYCEVEVATGDHEDDNHIVSDLQHWLGRLGIKVPRALCGELRRDRARS